jgi:6-pyruvoyltetrahydropterin/6-carboxytetrahydropterin synthase
MHKVTRYHDISCGHRVDGHEGKCRHLHGHNYRIHFTCVAGPKLAHELDTLGRVIDFTVIKERLCMWLEDNWDHKFLAWEDDLLIRGIRLTFVEGLVGASIVLLPFNPTAENMAQYLVEVIGPEQLRGTGVKLISVTIEETAKCHATFTLEEKNEN